jgi:hypothetical protein
LFTFPTGGLGEGRQDDTELHHSSQQKEKPMTQSPLGHDPSQPGPFDGPGPGEPDLPTTQQDLTTTQGASLPDDPALSPTAYPGEDAGTATTPVSGTGHTGGAYPPGGVGPHAGIDVSGGNTATDQPSTSSSSDTGSRTDAAKGEAKQVADTAVGQGKQVAQTAKDEAQNVVAETKQQAASLFDTVRSEVGSQAGTQQNRIADALHGLAKELGGMASASEQSGPLTDLAHQASRKGGEVAHWLQDREPADVLESVRSYGRRHPVTFLALCGLAGVVAGRLTRSAVASNTSLDSTGNGSGGDRRSYPTTPAVPVTPPVVDPVIEPAPPSTGIYGGSLESTAPADPYADDRPPTGPGYVSTSTLDNPNGEPLR